MHNWRELKLTKANKIHGFQFTLFNEGKEKIGQDLRLKQQQVDAVLKHQQTCKAQHPGQHCWRFSNKISMLQSITTYPFTLVIKWDVFIIGIYDI